MSLRGMILMFWNYNRMLCGVWVVWFAIAIWYTYSNTPTIIIFSCKFRRQLGINIPKKMAFMDIENIYITAIHSLFNI